MANEEHLARLRKGVDAWNAWREEHPDLTPDLREINLYRADLREANLYGAYLEGADLRWVNLEGGNLRRASLSRANLSGGNLEAERTKV